ncbi:hypothetical protein Tco_0164875, partial [Tanacetum coccineum]
MDGSRGGYHKKRIPVFSLKIMQLYLALKHNSSFGKGPTWPFDLDYLTDSMNYHPVISENQANHHAGQQEVNQNAGTEDIIDAGDSEKEMSSTPRLFVLVQYASYHQRANLNWVFDVFNFLAEDSSLGNSKKQRPLWLLLLQKQNMCLLQSWLRAGLVQPTQVSGTFFKRPSEAQPTPSPTPTSEVPHEPQTDSSPAHTRNEGEMTLQSVYDLCLSLCAQVSDQAKEIQHLKAQIKKLKKQAKPVIKHHRAWMQSISLKQRLARKRSSKKQWVHKESVSKQGRKFAKGESSVQGNPLFDEIPEDTVDHMETENAQDVGRTREIVDEEKEIDENILSTEDVLSTDGSKVSTDRQIEGTDEQIEGTEEQIESTDGQRKGTEDHTEEGSATQATQTPTSTIFGDDETIAKVLLNMSQAKAVSREKEKGVELKDIEETDRPRPTSTRSLLTLRPLPKIDPKDKGKKKIEEEDETDSESDDIPQAEKKFKQLESDEEMARKIQEEWEGEEERNRIAEEKATNEALIRNFDDIKARIKADRLLAEKLQEQEREQFTIEERAKFLYDIIAAQRKFLAQQRSEAIRNRPPIKNQLRNKMMTYLKHVGNFKHAELKIKKFEEIQAPYEKIKRSDEDFISIGSAEDERLIKRMNKKRVDSSKSEVIKEENKEEAKEENKEEANEENKEEAKEENKEEESTRKRKLGTRKKMKS